MLLARAAHAQPHEKRTDDGYAGWVVFGDALAASLPLVILATDTARQSLVGGDLTPVALVFAFAPIGPTILSPIIHGAHGRKDAVWISTLGWSGAALISAASALLLLPRACAVDSTACPVDSGRAAAVIAVSASLTVGMIIGDSQLARGHVVRDATAFVMPTIMPVASGATVGVAGAF